MTNAKKIVRSAIWSMVEAGGASGLQFITLIIMARLLAPAEFGLAALTYGVISLMAIMVSGLFNEAIIQRRDLRQAHLDSAFWCALGVSGLLVACSWASAPYWAAFFEEPAVAPVLAWMSISLLAQGASCVHAAKFHRDLNFKALAQRRLFGGLVGSAIGIVLAFNGFGVWSLVGQRLTSATLSTILVWVSSPYRPGFALSWRALWELLRFGLPAMGSQFVHTGRERIFQLMMGYFLGLTVLGFVDIAFRTTFNLRRIISAAFYGVSLPILSRRQDDIELLKRSMLQATEYTCLAVLPLFAGLAVCAEEVVALVLGVQWMPAVPLIQVLCAAVMLGTTRQIYGTAINAIGKPQINLMVATIGLVISILAVLAFGREDMVVAILVWNCSFAVTWPINSFLIQRLVGLSHKEQAAAFAGPMAAAVVMAIGLYGIKASFLAELGMVPVLLVIVPLGVLLYVGLIMLLRPKLIPDFHQLVVSALRREGPVAAK